MWKFKDIEVKDLPEGTFGFIYLIHYDDGTKYIGKKQCTSKTKKYIGKKKEKLLADKRASKFETVEKETNWRTYEGSSKTTVDKTIKLKEILKFCTDKINLTYWEMAYQVHYNVLLQDEFLNENIGGRFFKGRITN